MLTSLPAKECQNAQLRLTNSASHSCIFVALRSARRIFQRSRLPNTSALAVAVHLRQNHISFELFWALASTPWHTIWQRCKSEGSAYRRAVTTARSAILRRSSAVRLLSKTSSANKRVHRLRAATKPLAHWNKKTLKRSPAKQFPTETRAETLLWFE